MAAKNKSMTWPEYNAKSKSGELTLEQKEKISGFNKKEEYDKNGHFKLGTSTRDFAKITKRDGNQGWAPLKFKDEWRKGSNLIVQPAYKDGKLVTWTPESGPQQGQECVMLNVMLDRSRARTDMWTTNDGPDQPDIIDPHFDMRKQANIDDNGNLHYNINNMGTYTKKDFEAIVKAAKGNSCTVNDIVVGQNTKTNQPIPGKVGGEVYAVRAQIIDCNKYNTDSNRYTIKMDTLTESGTKITPESYQAQMDYCAAVRSAVCQFHSKQKDFVPKTRTNEVVTTKNLENAIEAPDADYGFESVDYEPGD